MCSAKKQWTDRLAAETERGECGGAEDNGERLTRETRRAATDQFVDDDDSDPLTHKSRRRRGLIAVTRFTSSVDSFPAAPSTPCVPREAPPPPAKHQHALFHSLAVTTNTPGPTDRAGAIGTGRG